MWAAWRLVCVWRGARAPGIGVLRTVDCLLVSSPADVARAPRRSVSAFAELRASRELLLNLTLREIRGKYKRTALGQLWSLLNPIAQMVIYSLVFAFLLRGKPGPGNPSGLDVFALWLSAGLVPWLFVSNVISTGMASVVGNAGLVQKVYFARETLVISNMLSWLFTHLIEMGVLVAATLAFGGQPLLYLPATLYFIAMLALFALGISYALAVANVYFRDTQHLITLLMQMWMYGTPIFYSISLVESHSKRYPHLRFFYRLNPLERFTEVFRNTIYDGRWPSWSNTVFITVASLVVLFVGRAIFLHFEDRLAEEL
jgi:ABC-type polysaccharide/polyol phosphate export permease